MFKRFFAILLIGACFLFVACSDVDSSTETESSQSQNSSSFGDSETNASDVSTDSVGTENSSSINSETNSSSDVSSSTDSNGGDASDSVDEPSITGGFSEVSVLEGDLIATSVCTLRNLPVDKAVQRFSVVRNGGKLYIFTTQRSGSTVYLSRCLYNEKTKIATCLDSVTLPDYGHGESLEVRVRDGKFYVYITSGALKEVDNAWGTTISRFVYNAGRKIDTKTLTDLHCSTENGQTLHENATTYRVNFSFDEVSDRFLIYVRCDTDRSLKNLSHYFVSYRLSDLDRLLDEAPGEISMKDCTSAFMAYHGKISYKTFCPHGSFQGMDVCSDGTVYITGGAEGQQPQVCRAHLTEKGLVFDEFCDISEIYAARVGMDKEYMKTLGILPEIESFQLFEGYCYVSFNPGSGMKKNNTEVFVLTCVK